MKIINVESIILRQQPSGVDRSAAHGSQDPLIIRIETDEGIVGYGEADTFAWVAKPVIDSLLETEVASGLAALLIGEDPSDPHRIWTNLYERTMYYGRRGVVLHAMSGVEIALWDLYGKFVDKPIHALLGGARRDKIRTYATIGMPEHPDEVQQSVDRIRNLGFHVVKFGSGPLGFDEETDVSMVAAAREAVGQDGQFMIDIGRRWRDPKQAIARVKKMVDSRPYWIEEPFLPDEYASYQELASVSEILIAAGEQESGYPDFERLVDLGVAVLQPDVARAGGIAQCLRVAELARERGRLCAPHEWGTGIAKAATLHVIAAMQEVELFEYRVDFTAPIDQLVSEKFPVIDGSVNIPQGPGLGIEIDEDVLEASRAMANESERG